MEISRDKSLPILTGALCKPFPGVLFLSNVPNANDDVSSHYFHIHAPCGVESLESRDELRDTYRRVPSHASEVIEKCQRLAEDHSESTLAYGGLNPPVKGH